MFGQTISRDITSNRVYAATARFDTGRAMTEDEMRGKAPSIFAVDKHYSRSDRFAAIPTIEVVRGLQKEGYSPVGVIQSRCRDASRHDFTKHLIRFRRLDDGKKYVVGDTVLELLMRNANDGSSAYDLYAGLFRATCLNSMVTSLGEVDSAKVRHSGDVTAKVIEGTYRVLGNAERVLAAPDGWSQIQLAKAEAEAFAKAAHVIRFADAEGEAHTPITPAQLLIPRRAADTKPDLWTVFNVLQENTIKGGISADGVDRHNHPRRFTTREVKGIDQNLKVNQALWVLGEEMAKLKAIA